MVHMLVAGRSKLHTKHHAKTRGGTSQVVVRSVRKTTDASSETTRIVIEKRPFRQVVAIIGVSALAALGVSISAISYADYRAGERIEEADRATQENLDHAARIGDCLLGNSRVVSAEASQRFIAEANQKASELLDNKVAKPLENATGPLTDLSRAVPTTTTTESTTTTTQTAEPPLPEGENAAAPPPVEQTTTTITIPAHLPECSTVTAVSK